ncbi:MAG: hypothetical protein QXT26_02910 [Thermoproteota archaeon]
MKIYEYIFAAVIMVAILIAAVFLTGISPQLYRSISEVEQLKIASQKIMAQILLSPGEPEDWGENIIIRAENLSSFGLAVSTVFTRDAFVLDPDKIQKLSHEIPSQLYMPPSKALELLNLGFDYGIKIEFIPALNITVSLEDSDATIMVLSEQGTPASHVKVIVIAFRAQGGNILSNSPQEVYDADGDGVCHVSFPFNPEFLVAVADHYGVQMIYAYSSIPRTSYLIGRYLLVDSSLTIPSNNALQVFAVRLQNRTIKLMNVMCSLEQCECVSLSGYSVYDMGYAEPNIIAVVTLANDGSLVAAHKIIPSKYSSIAGEVYPPLAYMLERSVKIGLSTYTLRLTVWRMAW